jgi:rhodanese-related sulfurtransferase
MITKKITNKITKKITKTHPHSRRNSTLKAPCEVCSKKPINKKYQIYKLKAGDTHLRKYLPINNKLIPSNGSETVILEGLKTNKTIVYFASNSPYPNFTANINAFVNAYDKLQNSGVGKTDNNGNITIKINCPQVYLAEDNQIYSRHIHWIYWNNTKQIWETHIYTHQIFCKVDREFVKKIMKSNSKVLIIDALSPEYYNQKHIKGAINIPGNSKLTMKMLLDKLPKNTNSTTPMILYCYSPKCNAAEKLWTQLNKYGFYNTLHYSGGITNWNGETSNRRN